jgi:hypothetical protein
MNAEKQTSEPSVVLRLQLPDAFGASRCGRPAERAHRRSRADARQRPRRGDPIAAIDRPTAADDAG